MHTSCVVPYRACSRTLWIRLGMFPSNFGKFSNPHMQSESVSTHCRLHKKLNQEGSRKGSPLISLRPANRSQQIFRRSLLHVFRRRQGAPPTLIVWCMLCLHLLSTPIRNLRHRHPRACMSCINSHKTGSLCLLCSSKAAPLAAGCRPPGFLSWLSVVLLTQSIMSFHVSMWGTGIFLQKSVDTGVMDCTPYSSKSCCFIIKGGLVVSVFVKRY